ncbi:MAG: leucine-rich repeat protein, partial [Prevotella sp.]|nr:leucine-rich repeat protein [Prevotella sp.]
MNKNLLKNIVIIAIMLLMGGNMNAQKKAYVHFSNIVNGGMLMRFYYDDQISQHGGKVVIIPAYMSNNWNNHDMTTITRVIFDASFKECTSIKSTHGWFYGCSKLTQIDHLDYLNTDSVTDMSCMFYNCSKLTSIDVSHFNTENVTNMWEMFRECSSLTELDLSNFNTNKLKTFYWMFRGCRNLEKLNISSFNTENVISFDGLFTSCAKLKTLDVSHFNTENAQVMEDMFFGCSSLEEIDVSNFNTSKVYSMDGMFTAMSKLKKLDIRNFNTSAVKNMNSMFQGCSSLTRLNLSNFDTRKVTNIAQMFWGCKQLKTIYAGDEWSTDAVPDGYGNNVFKDCTELVGGKGTTFNEEHIDCSYARIDGGIEAPGYLTHKDDMAPEDNTVTIKDEETGTTITAEVKEPAEEGEQPTATITTVELTEGQTTVVIPETVNDAVVNEIGEGFTKDNKDITEVVIPETVETIGNDAFSGCENLTGDIDLTNVKEIGEGAFNGCSGIEEFHFGQDAADITIGKGAFTHAVIDEESGEQQEQALNADIYIPAEQRDEYREKFGKEEGDPLYPYFQEESEKIFEEFKDENSGMEFVGKIDNEGNGSWSITDGTTAEGNYEVPEQLFEEPITGIGEGAFKDNDKITGITLPEAVETIGNDAFSGCENLTGDIDLTNVKEIGEGAFNGCTGIEEFHFGQDAADITIGKGAFTHVVIDEESGEQQEQALNADIFLPPTQREDFRDKFGGEIGLPLKPYFDLESEKVFEEFKNEEDGTEFLGSIDLEGQSSWTITDGTTAEGNFEVPEQLFDEPVTGIGKGAFMDNMALTGVELNNNIQFVEAEAFSGCENLTGEVELKGAKEIGEN